MIFFCTLLQKSDIKLVGFTHSVCDDPDTGLTGDNWVCYIETEHAFCDSSGHFCVSKDVARECAARRFIELLEENGWDDLAINNLHERSSSPGFDPTVIERSKSTSPRRFSLRRLLSPRKK